jgi:hypothetical protein
MHSVISLNFQPCWPKFVGNSACPSRIKIIQIIEASQFKLNIYNGLQNIYSSFIYIYLYGCDKWTQQILQLIYACNSDDISMIIRRVLIK